MILVLFAGRRHSGALAFWPDFFRNLDAWRNSLRRDAGDHAAARHLYRAPAMLALSYANYSNRGPLLLWTKSLQLAIFLVLSIAADPARSARSARRLRWSRATSIAQLGILVRHHRARDRAASGAAYVVSVGGKMVTIVAAARPSAWRSVIWCPEPGSRIFWPNARSGSPRSRSLAGPLASRTLRERRLSEAIPALTLRPLPGLADEILAVSRRPSCGSASRNSCSASMKPWGKRPPPGRRSSGPDAFRRCG